MYTPDPKEIESVSKLPFDKRYSYFIKRVADAGQVWALWENGWMLGETSDGQPTFPLWPAREFAERCREDYWKFSQARSIPLQKLVDHILPGMIEQGIKPSVFDLPNEDSATLKVDDFVRDLQSELSKYE